MSAFAETYTPAGKDAESGNFCGESLLPELSLLGTDNIDASVSGEGCVKGRSVITGRDWVLVVNAGGMINGLDDDRGLEVGIGPIVTGVSSVKVFDLSGT